MKYQNNNMLPSMIKIVNGDSTLKTIPHRIFRLLVNQLFVQWLKINSNFREALFWMSVICSTWHCSILIFYSVQLIYKVKIRKLCLRIRIFMIAFYMSDLQNVKHSLHGLELVKWMKKFSPHTQFPCSQRYKDKI